MNKKIVHSGLLVLIVLTLMTGCFEKRKALEINEDNIYVKLNIMEKIKYTFSQELKDFKSSRECGMIINDNFKIGIEINKDMSYEKYKGSFEKLKKGRSESTEFKEVTYSGIKGFQRYNESYMRYEVYLPIKGTNERCLQLNIYSTLNRDEETRKQYTTKEVQDILNHVKVKYITPKETKEETNSKETKKTTEETKKEEETTTEETQEQTNQE